MDALAPRRGAARGNRPRAGVWPFVEGAETGTGLGHHVQRQPRTIGLAVALPVFEFLLAHRLQGLAQAIGHRQRQLVRHRFDLAIEQAEIDPALGHCRFAGLACGASAESTVGRIAPAIERLCRHHRIGDERTVGIAQHRHDAIDQADGSRGVCGPVLTHGAGVDRSFDTDKQGKKVGGTASGAVPCFGPAWPKRAGRRNRKVAGHADLLATADTHPIHSVDNRLVAQQDARHHVVEQAHVLLVLLRIAGVVLGVLLVLPPVQKALSPTPVKTTPRRCGRRRPRETRG